MRIIALTALAMIAFAANSVFTRLGLAQTSIDPLVFTSIRLLSGALALAVLVWMQSKNTSLLLSSGTWRGATALASYAIFFTFAYITLGAGLGALVLFASVQITMIFWAIVKGERPGPIELIGILLAFGAFAYLVSPGLVAPDPLGTVLMVIAGISWGVYSLLGRGSRNATQDTMGNFVKAIPFAIAALATAVALTPNASFDLTGLFYAVLSGAIASGMGYAVWYYVLPQLARTSAGVVQLTVPAIATAGGILFLGELITARFLIASALILLGVALATLFKKQTK